MLFKEEVPAINGIIDNFSYAKGGSDWPELFSFKVGTRQSPIDIIINTTVTQPEEAPIKMKVSFNKTQIPLSLDYSPTSFIVIFFEIYI